MTVRIPAPWQVATPDGADGWQAMYPYYLLFDATRMPEDGDKCWFCDLMHWPEPLYPLDAAIAEFAIAALSQYNTRIFAIPPTYGIELRILNGYGYLCPVPVIDADTVAARVPAFLERSGFYFDNWNALYARWKDKVVAEIEALRALPVPQLPELEDAASVTAARGLSSGFDLLQTLDALLASAARIWQYHFEFLNLGYLAYLEFNQGARQLFPDIDDQTLARMVGGIAVDLYRPDEELKRLATLAHDSGLATLLLSARNRDELSAALRSSPAGERWLAALADIEYPWFCFSSGTGFYHDTRSWIDDFSVPLAALKDYLLKLARGESLTRDVAALQTASETLAQDYESLIGHDDDRREFRRLLARARLVFAYVEEHNFYVEHWHHTLLWNKFRELGARLADAQFFADAGDVFYLNRFELQQALFDLYNSWANGAPARGPRYWPAIIAARKQQRAALTRSQPPPVLGVLPETITEPFTIMLWGLLADRLREQLGDDGLSNRLRGHPAAPGLVEGRARVVLDVEGLAQVQAGEILVCPITAPSWTPVFARAAGVITNVGGMMSHAAILCREFGVPAVVGTLLATQRIHSGDRVRLNGTTGDVEWWPETPC